MYNVQNKTAMITGAATGLGYKYAEILLRNGAKKIAVVDLPTSNGQDAVATLENEFGKGRVIFIACDVSKADDLNKTFEKIVNMFGRLDIFINNAGINNDNLWEQIIEVNVKAVIRGSLLAFNHMGKHKGGKGGVIVNISSVAGLYPSCKLPMYIASKHAVLGFSQSLAKMYDKTGMRVVIMCPGITLTAMVANIQNNICNSFQDLVDVERRSDYCPEQTTDNVALAMLDLIQKGENGAVWVSEGSQPP